MIHTLSRGFYFNIVGRHHVHLTVKGRWGGVLCVVLLSWYQGCVISSGITHQSRWEAFGLCSVQER